MPVVSVLLPVRNAAPTIERAITSIQAQTFRAWELIAIDDGSSDGTRAKLDALARDDARIRVLASDARGIVAVLNHGLAVARGEFIARMDADDESHPERLAAQVEFLRDRSNAGLGLVGCLVDFAGDRLTSEGYAQHVGWINSLLTSEEIALNRFIESPFAHPSVLFRAELVEKHGRYADGDFPEDYELWLRWMDAGVRMGKVPRVLLRWHDPPNRLSRTDPRYDPDAFFRLKAKWLSRRLRDLVAPRGATGPRPVWVWGAGRPTRKRAAYLEQHGVAIAGYIDVDPKKVTVALGGRGRPVIASRDLPPADQAFVLGYVASRGARELIRHELRARRYEEGRDFLMCA